jgi:nicotinate dehydrogenase subunit A
MSGRAIPIRVNGSAHELAMRETTPLLYVLRESLGLKGTRFGCGQGLCGACVVTVDGRAVFSCDTPLWQVAGASVMTVEGLADPATGRWHPLQQAFIDEQAGQCGYCLSGIVMRAHALLSEHPNPSRQQIVEALERHLCRCGAHLRIVRAIERAAAMMEVERTDPSPGVGT